MNVSGTTKTCKMCCMEIPQQARKCPYCQQFQDRRSMILYHPGVHVAMGLVPMLIMFAIFESLFSAGEKYESYKDQIWVYNDARLYNTMKAPDILGLVIRIVGFIIMIWSIWDLLGGLAVLAASFQSSSRPAEIQYSSSSFFITGLPALVFGLFCFLQTDRIVRWTYRE